MSRKRTHLADLSLRWSPLNRPPAVEDREAIWPTLGRRKVCIYGAGLGRHQAPLDDPSWTVWALNLVVPFTSNGMVRADAWFDLHQKVAQTDDDLRWIAKCPVPIYVTDDLVEHGANTVRFPLAELEEEFGVNYWSCTFAYQIALAMSLGFDEIGLYGVELAYGPERERTVEWACTNFWLGMAKACGMRLHTPVGSRLVSHEHRYGFDYTAEVRSVESYISFLRESDRAGQGG